MRRAQSRAKIGATPTAREGETAGEILEVPVLAKTQAATAGAGDTI
jgi:hypothetical protein